LDDRHLRRIIDIQLERVGKRLRERNLSLAVSRETRDYLAQVGYDPEFGARPLKRAIQRQLLDPLAKELLAGRFDEGVGLEVTVDPEHHQVKFGKVA